MEIFVGGIQGRLRGDERPGADAGVRGGKLKGGDQPEQYEFLHGLSKRMKLQPIFANSVS